MRRQSRVVVLLLVTCLVFAVAPAALGASHGAKATFSVDSTSVTPPVTPELQQIIQDRCGADWPGWIYEASGMGTLTVGKEVYEDAVFEFEHCSRWQTLDPERTTGRMVGKTEAGEMIVTVPDVGSLTFAYSGTWVMFDFLFVDEVPVSYTADLHLRYTVEGGTDGFADVSRGHGQLSMTVGSDGPPYGSGRMAGSLE